MIEFELTQGGRKITLAADLIESIGEGPNNSTNIGMTSGQSWCVNAPYDQVRLAVGMVMGWDLEDEEFEGEGPFGLDFGQDDEFLGGCNQIG